MLVAAIVYMCIGGVCEQKSVEIEKRACTIGTIHGKMLGMDVKMGVKCEQRS